MKPLWKTTIVIWSEFDASQVEIDYLARDASNGDSICTSSVTERIDDPPSHPGFAATGEFFYDHDTVFPCSECGAADADWDETAGNLRCREHRSPEAVPQ